MERIPSKQVFYYVLKIILTVRLEKHSLFASWCLFVYPGFYCDCHFLRNFLTINFILERKEHDLCRIKIKT